MTYSDRKVNIGRKIRQLRTIRNISLQVLAEELGMSYSYLSALENDKHSISLNNLQRIANFFEVDLVSFLTVNNAEVLFVPKNNRPVTCTDDGIIFELITNESIKNLQVTFVKIPPNAPKERNIHNHKIPNGEEFITVIKGNVIVIVEDAKYKLNEGDSIIFSSKREHTIYTEESECDLILISSPPYSV